MMGWSPRCYIPSFVEIDLPVPEKKIFKGFLPYMGMAPFDHMTSIMSTDFHFLVPESIHKNLAQICKKVSEKILFEFLYVHNLGPRSRNDLDLQYSHIFIKSISLKSQAAIVSEKSIFFTFSYSKAKFTKFDIAVK